MSSIRPAKKSAADRPRLVQPAANGRRCRSPRPGDRIGRRPLPAGRHLVTRIQKPVTEPRLRSITSAQVMPIGVQHPVDALLTPLRGPATG